MNHFSLSLSLFDLICWCPQSLVHHELIRPRLHNVSRLLGVSPA